MYAGFFMWFLKSETSLNMILRESEKQKKQKYLVSAGDGSCPPPSENVGGDISDPWLTFMAEGRALLSYKSALSCRAGVLYSPPQ